LKSIREIGNLSLNRINLLGMLQRAFNSRQKKRRKKSPSLSLCFIPVEKLCPGSERGERGTERSPLVHPLFA